MIHIKQKTEQDAANFVTLLTKVIHTLKIILAVFIAVQAYPKSGQNMKNRQPKLVRPAVVPAVAVSRAGRRSRI